jgi:DNA-binding MarR family transcriptional regulator
MNKTKRTSAGEALTDVVLDLFRLNSLLLTAGDRLVAGLGLTSARWQILGAMVAAERPQPVAWLARDMGANRQNVQRIINDLQKEGLVTFEANPHHRRAQLVLLTAKGKQTFDAAMRLQAPWIDNLSDGLSIKDVKTFRRVIMALRQKLESNQPVERHGTKPNFVMHLHQIEEPLPKNGEITQAENGKYYFNSVVERKEFDSTIQWFKNLP